MAKDNKFQSVLTGMVSILAVSLAGFSFSKTHKEDIQSVEACVFARNAPLTKYTRMSIAQCLGWEEADTYPVCHGRYTKIDIPVLEDPHEMHIFADEVSLYAAGVSRLQGHVKVQDSERIVHAETALIHRDAKTNKITRVELLGDVRYQESGRFMVANKAILNPEDKSGHIEHLVYRFNNERSAALLPAWGRASWAEKTADQKYLMRHVTYTTCPPKDNAWQIEADEFTFDRAHEKAVAKNALLRVADLPVLYTPYMSFSTSNKRESGFLLPQLGYSNVGGADVTLPFYWNMAPNYDATIGPHEYSRRGVMVGGDFRFLSERSFGTLGGNILPKDRVFRQFIFDEQNAYPSLQGTSSNRWSAFLHETTALSDRLHFNAHYQQVSDDYYLQDFSTNLATTTDNQLLRQGDLNYTGEHWFLSALVQSYQTLHPINESFVSNIYERLPQLQAKANYDDLPFQSKFTMLSEYDQYHWPADNFMQPQGPRVHFEPTWSTAIMRPWGYIVPKLEFVENYYNVHYVHADGTNTFNRSIPRYSVDSNLVFERYSSYQEKRFTQTLEPRFYYLFVPYHDQTAVPVYDSAYMIFNYDQLFRNNRFSGFDRIGDTNQFSYGLTSRMLSDENGQEIANIGIGQIRYFSARKVQLCYQLGGSCVDNPIALGYQSPSATYSPVATRAMYQLSTNWTLNGDYVYDPSQKGTYAGDMNVHYQPAINHILNLGYTYLANGNVLQVGTTPLQDDSLHQGTVAYAWPFTEQWSGLGVYSYNISKRYSMLSFLGVQYDNCCWAMRIIGGRTFMNLSPTTLLPKYNNNIYVQILLKGLASVARGDPATTINTYLPGYRNLF